MKIKPLSDRVLVKQVAAESKTASGLIIPDTAQEKTCQATVVEIGTGTKDVEITVKPGEKIIYDKYSGTSIKMDGEEYLILKMSDIIAVISD